MSDRLAHFLTRLNTVRAFTGRTSVLEPEWLTQRFELFERFCFPYWCRILLIGLEAFEQLPIENAAPRSGSHNQTQEQ